MATGSKKSVSPTPVSEFGKSDVEKLLQSGLADFSLRELLGALISSVAQAERQVYLGKQPEDKRAGIYANFVIPSVPDPIPTYNVEVQR